MTVKEWPEISETGHQLSARRHDALDRTCGFVTGRRTKNITITISEKAKRD